MQVHWSPGFRVIEAVAVSAPVYVPTVFEKGLVTTHVMSVRDQFVTVCSVTEYDPWSRGP